MDIASNAPEEFRIGCWLKKENDTTCNGEFQTLGTFTITVDEIFIKQPKDNLNDDETSNENLDVALIDFLLVYTFDVINRAY